MSWVRLSPAIADRRWYVLPWVGAWVLATVLSVVFGPRPPAVGEVDLPDFSTYEDVSARKAAFFGFLEPIVVAENNDILRQRRKLKKLHDKLKAGGAVSWFEDDWLAALAERYGVALNEEQPLATTGELMLRVDTVPVPLALVQAAKESAWGRSRFARQANNLFGQWCYTEGCGKVPERRGDDQRHEVRAFDTVREAVTSYLHNLNTHWRYGELRQIRARLRQQGEPVTAQALAEGLLYYSERREAYVAEVRSMIRQYQRFKAQRQGG